MNSFAARDRVCAVKADEAKTAQAESSAAELTKLRNEVVAQARELAIIRWEISSLIRQHPVSARVTQAKYSVLRRFPNCAQKISKVRLAVRDLFAPLRHEPEVGSAATGIPGAGSLGSLPSPVLVVGDDLIVQRTLRAAPRQNVVVLDQGAGFLG